MRIVYMGTPDFAVPPLKTLIDRGHEIGAVVTQPDRPRGRGQKITPPPVKVAALEAGFPVLQPETIKDREFMDVLRKLSPQLIVVAAFGRILPPEILKFPQYGCINIHASLLPKYRGAAPIHWAVMDGETETGVTIMQMDEGLDTGDIILAGRIPVEPEDTTGTVHDKLAELGAQLVVKAVEQISAGRVARVPQNEELAGYAPLLTKEVERIDWSRSSAEIFNQVRGLNPWPGAYTMLGDRVLKVWKAEACTTDRIPGPVPELAGRKPGKVLGPVPEVGFAVATGNGCLAVEEVQMQGSRRMKASDFMRGYDLPDGTLLG
ncbi:MAG: methionyl-tRNA formyltransferase [Firmicutes bacterium HGW-Firmicutes-14]|nr:MAG: methionyl-tRNA formyltransferase [Firmicutes bacterium HGW-Firmicutes-14]